MVLEDLFVSFLSFFLCLKTLFCIFINENSFNTGILMLNCTTLLFVTKPKKCCVIQGAPMNMLKLFLAKCFINFLSTFFFFFSFNISRFFKQNYVDCVKIKYIRKSVNHLNICVTRKFF